MKYSYCIGLSMIFFICFSASAQENKVVYSVKMLHPEKHLLEINVAYKNKSKKDTIDFYMPRWTPGYYQIMDFGNRLSDFSAVNEKEKSLYWKKIDESHWQIYSAKSAEIILRYEMKEERNFVAESYADSDHAYILPTNLFLYTDDIQAESSILLKVWKYPQWPDMYGTGLDLLSSNKDAWIFKAATLDDFYDSPVLIGKLDTLHSFTIQGIEHQFVGFKIDKNIYTDRLMNDMQKIIAQAIDMFKDIPYHKYVFLGIGPGQGGIEHLNSASVSFSGKSLKDKKSYLRTLSFLTHEYFHNFNVKRIRPIELGPFDYRKENRTRQLWISEGLSVYYENQLLYKAGFYYYNDFLKTFADAMNVYENKPGHMIQSLASSSWNTWSDGPFGNNSDTAISYYDKGPVVGLLFDCALKHYSQNKYNLDSVMVRLYYDYYKKKKRGFTEDEFKRLVISLGGENMLPLFDLIYTAKPVDYNQYLQWENLYMTFDSTADGKKIFHISSK